MIDSGKAKVKYEEMRGKIFGSLFWLRERKRCCGRTKGWKSFIKVYEKCLERIHQDYIRKEQVSSPLPVSLLRVVSIKSMKKLFSNVWNYIEQEMMMDPHTSICKKFSIDSKERRWSVRHDVPSRSANVLGFTSPRFGVMYQRCWKTDACKWTSLDKTETAAAGSEKFSSWSETKCAGKVFFRKLFSRFRFWAKTSPVASFQSVVETVWMPRLAPRDWNISR